ncbi:MAG: hypothetical protein HY848_12090 [Betaproteobacteria bacterium]|nr:hypothetical protein [Betaproteobacteria bacterium]
MTRGFTKSTVESAALAWIESAGWQFAHGPDIALDMPAAERSDYPQAVLQNLPARHAAAQAHL